MIAHITACDKDSSAGYTKTIEFQDKETFLEQMKELEQEIPFARWYWDVEAEEEVVESWLE